MSASDPRFADLTTPCLLLDEAKLNRNVARLAGRAQALGVTLRPHMKTGKSVEVARSVTGSDLNAPIIVSTLAEAEVFAEAGHRNIMYGVGIAPGKLERIKAIRSKGADLSVILDSRTQAQAIADAGGAIPALIEIDADDHRSGVRPGDPELVAIGRILAECGSLRGVMTHAGESYEVRGAEAHAACAEQERAAVVTCAEKLRGAGLECPVVSVGSTPTAHGAKDLTGVTELRAGVYTFFDLFMAGIDVCTVDDIALSVLTTVIGHQREKGWIITDAGWMAMSRDRGTANQRVDQGYGLVCDEAGAPIPDLMVAKANQEHGIVTLRPGSSATLPDLPIGTRLRVLPNHACATAAQHQRYYVIPPEPGAPLEEWSRFGGW